MKSHNLQRSARNTGTGTKPTSEIVRYANRALERQAHSILKLWGPQHVAPIRDCLLQAHRQRATGQERLEHERARFDTPRANRHVGEPEGVGEHPKAAATPSHHDPLQSTRFWPEGTRRKRRFLEMESLESSQTSL